MGPLQEIDAPPKTPEAREVQGQSMRDFSARIGRLLAQREIEHLEVELARLRTQVRELAGYAKSKADDAGYDLGLYAYEDMAERLNAVVGPDPAVEAVAKAATEHALGNLIAELPVGHHRAEAARRLGMDVPE